MAQGSLDFRVSLVADAGALALDTAVKALEAIVETGACQCCDALEVAHGAMVAIDRLGGDGGLVELKRVGA